MSLLDMLFPRTCFECGEAGAYVCAKCLNSIVVKDSQKCPECERGSVFGLVHSRCRKTQSLDGLTIGFAYQGLIKKLIHKYKFSYISDLLDTLVDLWVSYAELEALTSKGPFLVTCVPVSPVRLRARGYNQAKLVAVRLADYFGWQYKDTLERIADTPSQSSLSRELRSTNVRGAFGLKDTIDLEHSSILLIDDVWTTGATMRECGKVLKRSGVRFVWGATLAG